MIEHIQWLGHSSFVIQGSPTIYINPWRVTRAERPADAILITNDHHENFSVADIAKLRGEHTQIITNARVAKELEGCTVLRPWQSACIGRTCIKAVPAYSLNDSSYALEQGGLGFVISMNFYDIYYAGDTERIPEMASIHPDIAILPIDGSGTMTADEAALAVAQMRPRWAIPCNWNSSNRVSAAVFQREAAAHTEVVLLTPGKPEARYASVS
jgi:L-ascorbate metabolism protein UlaG (beta-lactamase superfamily)